MLLIIIFRAGTPLVSNNVNFNWKPKCKCPKSLYFGFQLKWKELLIRGLLALVIIISSSSSSSSVSPERCNGMQHCGIDASKFV